MSMTQQKKDEPEPEARRLWRELSTTRCSTS